MTYKGVSRTLEEWAKVTGIHKATLQGRLKRGWTIEKAIETPLVKRGNGARGKWGAKKNEKLKREQITDQAALSLCFGIIADIRKDLIIRITHGKPVEDLEGFFETPLCALMFECMGWNLEGRQAFDKMVKDARKEAIKRMAKKANEDADTGLTKG